MNHHKAAAATIAAAAALNLAFGTAFAAADHLSTGDGLYFAITTATTVGYGDITPRGWLAHLLAVAMMLTVVPLFAATFSLFTSGLTAGHVRRAEQAIKDHVTATPGTRG